MFIPPGFFTKHHKMEPCIGDNSRTASLIDSGHFPMALLTETLSALSLPFTQLCIIFSRPGKARRLQHQQRKKPLNI
jgi:hypothetical protein